MSLRNSKLCKNYFVAKFVLGVMNMRWLRCWWCIRKFWQAHLKLLGINHCLWNFTMARTHLQKSFVLVMHRSGKLRYFVSNFHIKADLRAHSALQQVIIFQKQPNFWYKRFASFEGRNQGQDGLLFAKSLLSHSLMHLAVVSVLRTIGFPSSIQTSKLKFYLFRTILKY